MHCSCLQQFRWDICNGGGLLLLHRARLRLHLRRGALRSQTQFAAQAFVQHLQQITQLLHFFFRQDVHPAAHALMVAWSNIAQLISTGLCQADQANAAILRIGAALTVTLNLPYRWINSADVTTHRDGTGTIALDLRGETRFSYLVLWPHVRPWVISRTQPALRCIPEPDKVAALIAEA
ncbi:MAG: PH domain-containing protein, partial [Chloroflexaceae bacterium]|nr:PH domain-containing protein [Chloroflexaceae bacterium]